MFGSLFSGIATSLCFSGKKVFTKFGIQTLHLETNFITWMIQVLSSISRSKFVNTGNNTCGDVDVDFALFISLIRCITNFLSTYGNIS